MSEFDLFHKILHDRLEKQQLRVAVMTFLYPDDLGQFSVCLPASSACSKLLEKTHKQTKEIQKKSMCAHTINYSAVGV